MAAMRAGPIAGQQRQHQRRQQRQYRQRQPTVEPERQLSSGASGGEPGNRQPTWREAGTPSHSGTTGGAGRPGGIEWADGPRGVGRPSRDRSRGAQFFFFPGALASWASHRPRSEGATAPWRRRRARRRWWTRSPGGVDRPGGVGGGNHSAQSPPGGWYRPGDGREPAAAPEGYVRPCKPTHTTSRPGSEPDGRPRRWQERLRGRRRPRRRETRQPQRRG